MEMNRKLFYGMASAAVIALVVTLNTVGAIGKTNPVSALDKASNTIQANVGVTEVKANSTTKTNVEVLSNNAGAAVASSKVENATDKPQVEVPVDLGVEKGDQKNADAGSSPWKLDPVFVSQVFVSLKISPEGI